MEQLSRTNELLRPATKHVLCFTITPTLHGFRLLGRIDKHDLIRSCRISQASYKAAVQFYSRQISLVTFLLLLTKIVGSKFERALLEPQGE